ncbi:MAG: HAD family phosphatase [Desulforhopalus sp.]
MIEALIFDFGRVVSAQKPGTLFQRYENELGLAAGTINTIMFDSVHWRRALVGELEWAGYWQAIGPALHLNSAEAISTFAKRYYSDERMNRNVLELIRSYLGKYKMAILSNHPPGLSEWLADWGIEGLFDEVFCSGDEGAAKPDIQVYKEVLMRLKVSACEAVFIDDTPGHVLAASSLGMHGIVFTKSAVLKKELATLLVEKTSCSKVQ